MSEQRDDLYWSLGAWSVFAAGGALADPARLTPTVSMAIVQLLPRVTRLDGLRFHAWTLVLGGPHPHPHSKASGPFAFFGLDVKCSQLRSPDRSRQEIAGSFGGEPCGGELARLVSAASGAEVWAFHVDSHTDGEQAQRFREGRAIGRWDSNPSVKGPEDAWRAVRDLDPEDDEDFARIEPVRFERGEPSYVLGRKLGVDPRWLVRWSGQGIAGNDLMGKRLELDVREYPAAESAEPKGFTIAISEEPLLTTSALVLRVDGKLDLEGDLGKLETCLTDAEKMGRVRVVLDLERLSFLGSKALAMLGKFSLKFQEKGGKIALARVAPGIQLVLKTVGLPALLPWFPSIDEAKGSFYPKRA
jgi:anti-anti-sigma factor